MHSSRSRKSSGKPYDARNDKRGSLLAGPQCQRPEHADKPDGKHHERVGGQEDRVVIGAARAREGGEETRRAGKGFTAEEDPRDSDQEECQSGVEQAREPLLPLEPERRGPPRGPRRGKTPR